MDIAWILPNADEAKRGIIAVDSSTPYFCFTRRGFERIRFDSKGQPARFGYTARMLENRARRGANLPDWFKAAQPLHNDLEADWWDYLGGAKPSLELVKKLETLGSYTGQKSSKEAA